MCVQNGQYAATTNKVWEGFGSPFLIEGDDHD